MRQKPGTIKKIMCQFCEAKSCLGCQYHRPERDLTVPQIKCEA